jgi:hypothetical protein
MVERARGWAVRQGPELVVQTVTESRRGAIINWLCTRGGMRIPSNTVTDEQVEAVWLSAIAQTDIEVLEVDVSRHVDG